MDSYVTTTVLSILHAVLVLRMQIDNDDSYAKNQ